MDEATYTITQKRFLRGQQTLTIDGGKIKALCRRGLSLQEYRFDLRGLLPDPLRVKRVPLLSATTSVLGIILAGLAWMGALRADNDEVFAVLAGSGIALVIITFIAVAKTCAGFTNVVLFQGPGGQIVLWHDLPNREQFTAFLAALTARIRNAQSHERDILQQLRRAGIIDDWQYDQAMELLEHGKDRPEGP